MSYDVVSTLKRRRVSTGVGRFRRDGTEILSGPVSEICNLSVPRGVFPDACKVARLKLIYKKGKQNPPTTDLFIYFQ